MKFSERWDPMLIIESMATGGATESSSCHDLSWETCGSHITMEVSILSLTGPFNRLLEVFLYLLGTL
jgi:hypothetical protein